MTPDLAALLREWPYEPGQLNVRLIEGADGKPKVQMRVDLGILQMEVFGRPDGQRPEGCESLLEYHEMRIDGAFDLGALNGGNGSGSGGSSGSGSGSSSADEGAGAGSSGGSQPEREGGDTVDDGEEEFELPGDAMLSGEDCRQLREEAVQYYHRYISLLVLGDYDGVVRDTTRNMRVIDLCEEYAEEEDDREILAQFRPFIAMMRTRALASQMLSMEEPAAALVLIDVGINEVRAIYEQADRLEAFEDSHEAQLLRGMRAELAKKLPASQHSELKRRLEEALKAENYELAAILRDELRMLKD